MSKFRPVFAAILSLLFSASVFAAPVETPDRPGRPTPEDAGVPNQNPVPAPSKTPQTRPSATDDDGDAALLNQTAADLGIRPMSARPDEEILRWWGLRPQLEGYGLTLTGTFTADYSKNFQGGINTAGDDFRDLLDVRINVATRPLFNFYGGTFSIDFQNQAGQNGSTRLTQDAQGYDNIDADGRTQISELWYQQLLADDKIRIKVGKVDANSEFAFPANGAGFLNSSFGHTPTIVTMPTYPDPAMSVNLFVYPTRNFYGGAGVYDGSKAEGVETGSYGPRNFFRGGHGYFLIGETGSQWAFDQYTLPGRVAVGGWYSTNDFQRFDGTGVSGTGGVYAIAEQTLWHKRYYNPQDPAGITAFLQYGHADEHISPITDHAGGGVVWTGFTEKRELDAIGLGLTYARLSTDPAAGFTKNYEMTLETYYSLQLTKYLLIKPDLQYILHPAFAPNRDAMVFTIRATASF